MRLFGIAGGIDVQEASEEIRNISFNLQEKRTIDVLIEKIGDSRFVLLGESTHGTHEFYTWRSKISERLIKEKGFNFIAVEGDWPDCYKINRYVKGYPNAGNSAKEVLEKFKRWPSWMWANWEVIALVEWLKAHNQTVAPEKKIGFYGLDVYSLWESMESVLKYVEKRYPSALEATREAIRCFDPHKGDEGRNYARATSMVPFSCKEEVLKMLVELKNNIEHFEDDRESAMCAEQNAVVAVNAEAFYRKMMYSDADSWNQRDEHMVETINRLSTFYGSESKGIIWEHNTHIGDASATDMAEEGMINVGQLMKEQHKKDTYIIGFGANKGKVIAGESWGAPMEEMEIPEAKENSFEWLLHEASDKDKLIFTNDLKKISGFEKAVPHRAVGVVYHPWREKYGNYVLSKIQKRYDAFIYFDDSTAVHPLFLHPDGHLTPETYPWEV